MGRTGSTAGLKLEPHQVILRPMVTEKGMRRKEALNQYTFEVSPLATKEDIKSAVESLFNARVTRVHTSNRRGKVRRVRVRSGVTRRWKVAYVTLHPESRIDFF